MELRKNPEIDLDRKRGMFFSIGLVTSLAFVLAAFQWNVEKGIVEIPDPEEAELTYFMEPIATRHKEPERPEPIKREVVNPFFVEKEEIEKVAEEMVEEPLEPDDFDSMVITEPLKEEEPPEFVDYAQEMPVPVGGLEAFYQFLGKKIRYPHLERGRGIEGKVYVRFIIDVDGSLTNLEVIKSVSPGIDEEALRVLAMAPPWKPGRQQYKPVRVRMVLPITFKLN